MSKWKEMTTSFDRKDADRYLTRGDKKSEDMKVTGRYVPDIDTTQLPVDQFPDGSLPVRLMPGFKHLPYTDWIFALYSYYLVPFQIGVDFVHAWRTESEEKDRDCPLNQLRRELWNDGSERAVYWAKKLFPNPRYQMNCIIRLIQLEEANGKRVWCENHGPRILRLPQTPTDYIMKAFKNPQIGNPTDLEEAFDFLLHMEKKEVTIDGRKVKVPQYDGCDFARKLTSAGTDDEIEEWIEKLPNLRDEYKPPTSAKLTEIAEKCAAKAYDKSPKSGHVTKTDDGHSRPEDETEPSGRYGKRTEDPPARSRREEEPAPRSRREDDDPPPRSRREEEPPARSRREDDDPPPRSRREEEPAPRSRREDDDPPPRSRREEEHAPRSRREEEPPARSRREDDDPPQRSRREEEPAPRSRREEDDPPPARENREPRRERRDEDGDAPPARSRRDDDVKPTEESRGRRSVREEATTPLPSVPDGDPADDDGKWLDEKLARYEEEKKKRAGK
jgi:hypothetical protein